MTIFVSCSFDPLAKGVADWVQATFVANGIDAYISGQAEAKSLPESIREKIRSCEAMVTIVTDRFSAWVQNEIGIAYDARKPIYALIQEGVPVEGILQHITIYRRFNPFNPQTLMQPVNEVVDQIQQTRKQAATAAIVGLGLVLLLLLGMGASGK